MFVTQTHKHLAFISRTSFVLFDDKSTAERFSTAGLLVHYAELASLQQQNPVAVVFSRMHAVLPCYCFMAKNNNNNDETKLQESNNSPFMT